MKVWANVIAYELVWLAAVWGAGHGYWWLAPLALMPFALWYLTRADAALDAWLMLACVLIGALLESGLALSGLIVYASPFPLTHAAPVWILCIWAAFALTLRHSFRFFHPRLLIACVVGGVGAPVAYLGASHGWQAVTFPHGALPALLALGITWAVALPALLKLAVWLEATTTTSTHSGKHAHVV